MKELTAFQRDLMHAVAGLDQPNGLEIKNEIEEYYQTEINHGRLYPNLDTLVEKGLVEKGEIDQRTNFYELTTKGEEIMKDFYDWRDQYIAEELV